MFNKSKRLISLLLCLAMVLAILPTAVFAAAATTIYVQPNSNWLMDGARFAAYFFGNGETWLDCTDSDGDGIYEVNVPSGYENVIFCRMNPGSSANNWTNKWNQTSDLKVPTDSNVMYVVKGWDKGAGQWTTYGGQIQPTELAYYLVGSMNGWSAADTNKMTKNSDGTYSITMDLAAGSYEYKVTDSDGNWSPDPNMSVVVDSDCAVTFTLTLGSSLADSSVSVSGSGIGGETPDVPVVPQMPVLFLRGDMNYWGVTDMMNLGQDGKYTITMTLAPGAYEFKAGTEDWATSYPADYNMEIYVVSECDVTFTLDYASGVLTADGSGLGEKPVEEMVIESVHAVGSEGLTGIEWDPVANAMSEVNGVYTITFSGVAAGTYAFKFVANGSWDINWASGVEIVPGSWDTAWFNPMGDSSVTVAEDGSNVTLKLDLSNLNLFDGSGAIMMVEVVAPVVDPPEPVPTAPEPTDPEFPTAPDDGPIDEDAFKTVIAEALDTTGGEFEFCLSSDDIVTFRIRGFALNSVPNMAVPACEISVWNVTNDELVDSFYVSRISSVDMELSGGILYRVTINPAAYYESFGFGEMKSGTVSYKVVSNVELGEYVEPENPNFPGSMNNPFVFTENEYTATVPAGATVYFAHDDYVDYMNGTWAQIMTVTGVPGFVVNCNYFDVADTDGVASTEVYCNMMGKYLFAITNNTDSVQDYTVVFEDVPFSGAGFYEEAVDAENPYQITFSIDTPGSLNVIMGDCTPAWCYVITYPNGDTSLPYKQGGWEISDDMIIELTATGEYTISFYAWDASKDDYGAGTVSGDISFTASEGGEIVKEEYIVSDTMLELGDNTLTLDPNAITTIYEFCPDESGIYAFTASNGDALVGYWGAGAWFVSDQTENKSNVLECILPNAGPSIMVGVSGFEGDFVLTVERISDYNPIRTEWIEYLNKELESVIDFEFDGDETPIDVTDDIADVFVYNTIDGFYHYGSVTGPIIIANLVDNDFMSFMEALNNGRFRIPHYEEDGTVLTGDDISNAFIEYFDADDEGVVPLTQELYWMLYTLGSLPGKGWYDANVMGNYLFGDVTVDPETAFLAFCAIAEGTTGPVEAPVISKLENTATGIKITWNAVPGAAKYRVLMNVDGAWKTLWNTANTSYTWTGAESGKVYSFSVRCLSADGKEYTSSFNSKGWSATYVAQPSISKLENTTTGIRISWDKVPGAVKYKIVVKTADTGWTTVVNSTGTAYNWTGAESGVTYTFGIRCVTSDGKTYTSSFDTTGKSIQYIAAPTIAGLENTGNGIKITWKAVPGAAKYKLVVKEEGGSWKTIWNTIKTSYTWTGAEEGKTYTFAIRCTTADGKAYTSAFVSAGKTITPVATPTINKVANTVNGVAIAWNKVPGAVKYKIVVKTATSGWKTLGYSTGSTYTWTGATSGVTYTFTIRCVAADGTTYTSGFDSTGMSIKHVAAPAIAKLESTATGIKISWNKVAGAEKYKLVVKEEGGSWKTIWNTIKDNYLWTDAKEGVKYTFSIRCINAENTKYTSSWNSTGWTYTWNP